MLEKVVLTSRSVDYMLAFSYSNKSYVEVHLISVVMFWLSYTWEWKTKLKYKQDILLHTASLHSDVQMTTSDRESLVEDL